MKIPLREFACREFRICIGTLGLLAAPMAIATESYQSLSPRSDADDTGIELLAADALRPNERAFLEKAVESSRQQSRLAEVGASQASSSDVRRHALKLAADYRDLNDSLDALIRRHGGFAGAPVGGTSETYQKLAAQSGDDFDREFVRMAAALSDSVMALFEQAAIDAKDPEVREFAGARLPLLREHQNRAVELKKAFQ